MGLATVGRSRGAGAAGDTGWGLSGGWCWFRAGHWVPEAGQGVSLQGMAQGTVSLAVKGLVSPQRGRNGSGVTWQEMSRTGGSFLSPDGHKSAEMGWQDMIRGGNVEFKKRWDFLKSLHPMGT